HDGEGLQICVNVTDDGEHALSSVYPGCRRNSPRACAPLRHHRSRRARGDTKGQFPTRQFAAVRPIVPLQSCKSTRRFPAFAMSKSIGLTLLGCGTVGSGVVTILTEQAQLLKQRTGLNLELRHLVARDPSKPRSIPPGAKVTGDLRTAIDAPDVDVVVELIGG